MPGWGKGEAGGGQGRRGRGPPAPRPDAPPGRPAPRPPGWGCAAGAGVPGTRPIATPSGGGGAGGGRLGLLREGITMSPSAPEGLIPAGPRPGGHGAPLAPPPPLPAPWAASGGLPGQR